MTANDSNENNDIDQKIRLNELKEEIREVTGREPECLKSPECTPEIEEEFLRNMLAYESSPVVTQLEQVTRSGFELPEAERLDDAQISAKLADLITRLGRRRTFLYHTNHLSDRELYYWLRERGLREEVPDMPVSPNYSYHLDVLGSYGEAEVELFNKYYATEQERQKHAREYPDWLLPPHEDPKYNRDATLPNCGF